MRKRGRRAKPVRLRLLAEAVQNGQRADRVASVIYGVKICGLTSTNGRRYSVEALKAAVKLYEGAKLCANHPEPEDDTCRDVEDVMGEFHNVRFAKDGIYADVHLVPSHPMTPRLFEAAEKMPALYALSHNVYGIEEKRNGENVVVEITRVNSVDLVTDGATNKNLFEGTMNEDALEVMADEPEEGGNWKDDLISAISKLVQSEDEAGHEMAKKIMGMLKPEPVAESEDEMKEEDGEEEKKEEGDDEEEVKEGEGEEEKKEEEEDEDKKEESAKLSGKGLRLLESLVRKVTRLEKKLATSEAKQKQQSLTRLCESHGVQPDAITIKALRGLEGSERVRFLKKIAESNRLASVLLPSRERSSGNAPSYEGFIKNICN